MKKLILLASVAFSALALSASGAPATTNPVVLPVSRVSGQIESGSPRISVTVRLGQPTQRLSDNLWVYRGFRARNGSSAQEACDTLIVTFTDDLVTDLRLVNRPAEVAIAAQVKLNKSPQLTAQQ